MEAVAACLAGDLKLPIPEPMLVVVPTEWIAIVPDEERRRRIEASSPIAFGSNLVTGGYSVWTPDTRLYRSHDRNRSRRVRVRCHHSKPR